MCRLRQLSTYFGAAIAPTQLSNTKIVIKYSNIIFYEKISNLNL